MLLSCFALRPRLLGGNSSSASGFRLPSAASRLNASCSGLDAPGGRPRFRF